MHATAAAALQAKAMLGPSKDNLPYQQQAICKEDPATAVVAMTMHDDSLQLGHQL